MVDTRIPLAPQVPIRTENGVPLYCVDKKMTQAGGFALTYIATSTSSQQKVALKEFYPFGLGIQRDNQDDLVIPSTQKVTFQYLENRFYREALNLQKLTQPIGEERVVSIYDLFRDNNTTYIVMEYIEGESLTQYIARSGHLPWEEAVCLISDAAAALTYIHNATMIHQDVTPNNLMIRQSDKRVLLIDFGGVREFGKEVNLPMTSIITPGFAAPEQWDKTANGEGDPTRRGPWTDIYSLGATLYYTLTNDPDALFRGDVRQHCQQNSGTDPLVSLAQLAPERIPLWLSEAVGAMMAIDPQDRPQSIAACLTLLKQPSVVVTSHSSVQRTMPLQKATSPPAPIAHRPTNTPMPPTPPTASWFPLLIKIVLFVLAGVIIVFLGIAGFIFLG
jgi:serine/threonine protein kinase